MAGTNYLEFEMQYASIGQIYLGIKDSSIHHRLHLLPLCTSRQRLVSSGNLSNVGSKGKSPEIFMNCVVNHDLAVEASTHRIVGFCNTWYKIIGALSVLGRAAIICPVILLPQFHSTRLRGSLYSFIHSSSICCLGTKTRGIRLLGKRWNHMCRIGHSTCPWLTMRRSIQYTDVSGCKLNYGILTDLTASVTSEVSTDLLSILTVVFEFSSAVLIFVRCIQTFKDRRRSSNNESIKGFWDLTFQQVIVRCSRLMKILSFMSVFTTTSVILNFRASAGFYQRLLNALTLPLSGLLTSRFILHLRKCEHDLSDLERVAVDTVNSMVAGDILSSVIEPHFGWDPVEVDALLRTDLGMTENVV
ncbi:MAG: hypothetical protein NXY57DRAFT_1081834 [Lentinula lateritia]|nr:MAG: hypothetical protein NXY57DRAFT_1081834 [Lentinula lateritia]